MFCGMGRGKSYYKFPIITNGRHDSFLVNFNILNFAEIYRIAIADKIKRLIQLYNTVIRNYKSLQIKIKKSQKTHMQKVGDGNNRKSADNAIRNGADKF